MTYFWASALPLFLPVVLLLAGHWALRPPQSAWYHILSCLAGLAIGILAGSVLPQTQKMAFALTLAQTTVLTVFLLWQFNRFSDYVWQPLLVALAAVQWWASPALMSLTATRVINTDLLLNLASIVLVTALCMLLAALVSSALRLLPRLRWPLLLVTAAVLFVPISGNILLSLMKLQGLDLTAARLSYAARTTKLAGEISYMLLAVAATLAFIGIVTVVRQRRHVWKGTAELIARRIALADYRRVRSRQTGILTIAAILCAGQAYWDVIGSRPPQLSQATRVTLSESNTVRLSMTPLMDGNLHRFAWVADDGKVVRFFVTNRLADRVAPGVVFDACLLCGDKGYVQEGDQVVCIGCGVHLYKPSIGKPGGCNPVPIEGWATEGDTIVIPRTALEAGLQLFSTVLTIDVTDPVTGQKLTNTGAAHHYSHEGRTYFFASDSSFESFRSDPEKYVRKDTP